jgi:hypothetical protein
MTEAWHLVVSLKTNVSEVCTASIIMAAFEMSFHFKETTWRYIPESHHLLIALQTADT